MKIFWKKSDSVWHKVLSKVNIKNEIIWVSYKVVDLYWTIYKKVRHLITFLNVVEPWKHLFYLLKHHLWVYFCHSTFIAHTFSVLSWAHFGKYFICTALSHFLHWYSRKYWIFWSSFYKSFKRILDVITGDFVKNTFKNIRL